MIGTKNVQTKNSIFFNKKKRFLYDYIDKVFCTRVKKKSKSDWGHAASKEIECHYSLLS